MGFGTRALAWTVGWVAAFGLSAAANADDFYKDKTLRLVVGSGEGSGVDILGRIVAPPSAQSHPRQAHRHRPEHSGAGVDRRRQLRLQHRRA